MNPKLGEKVPGGQMQIATAKLIGYINIDSVSYLVMYTVQSCSKL